MIITNKTIFRHIESGDLLKVKKIDFKTNIHVFVEVDENGTPIKKRREWSLSAKESEQTYIIQGFKNLQIFK